MLRKGLAGQADCSALRSKTGGSGDLRHRQSPMTQVHWSGCDEQVGRAGMSTLTVLLKV